MLFCWILVLILGLLFILLGIIGFVLLGDLFELTLPKKLSDKYLS